MAFISMLPDLYAISTGTVAEELVEHSELLPNFSAIFTKDSFPNAFPSQLSHLWTKCKQFLGCASIPDLPLFRLAILLRDVRSNAVRLLS